MPISDFRIGYGYDAHRLVQERNLIIGGVNIPHSAGLLGHSDADVLYHAICDALLGALALGDIGKHFPDTDPRYKDVDSGKLLQATVNLVHSKSYTVGNIDATLRIQKPKVANYLPYMIKNISQILNIEEDRVSVKATTTEKMGFEGKEEGISASVVTLVFKN